MRSYYYYMGHTIIRSRTTTDGVKMVFGRPYPAIVAIYTIDGPVVMAGATERLTTIKECKELISEALKEKEDETPTCFD